MGEAWWRPVLRSGLLSVVVVALSWLLTKFESAGQSLALVAIFSAGVFLLIEAVILHRRIREPGAGNDPYYWLEVSRPRANWLWRVGTSLLLASSFGFISLLLHHSFRQTEPSQIKVRFTDEVENALTHHSGPTPGNVPPDGTLKLDSQLQAAMMEYFRKPAISTFGTSWWILIPIMAVSAALVAWAIKYEPEATPLAAAIAAVTATATVTEELVKGRPILPLGHIPLPAVFVALGSVALGGYLIWYGSDYLLRVLKSNGEISIKDGALLGAAVLVFGVTAALLGVLPLLLFHSEPVTNQPAACSQCPPPASAKDDGKIVALHLGGFSPLGDGRLQKDLTVNTGKIQQLIKDKAKEGDMLLLVGSSDCVPTRPRGLWKNNEELAAARAQWVFNGLKAQPTLHGVRIIEPVGLPEHPACGASPNVRAVYPFLIRAESAHSGHSQP